MYVLRYKLSVSIGAISAVALAGCAVFAPDDKPAIASNANATPVASSTATSFAARTPVRSPASTQPVQRIQPVQAITAGSYAPGFGPSRQSVTSFTAHTTRTVDTLAYHEIVQPRLKIVSPFDENSTARTPNTGLRTDGLGLDEWSTSPALSAIRGQLAAQRLSYGTLGQESYNAKFTFAAPSAVTGLNFDLGLVPSLSYAQEGDFTVRRLGAEFRFGQDIDQRGNNSGLPGWYFFAGADGEAVIFNNSTAGNGLGLIDGLQLRDQVTVGDIQAGLNLRRGGTNFAINYIRREVEYELNSETFQRDEDFGGITFTWRR